MVTISVPAILVKQRPQFIKDEVNFLKEYDFFVFSLSSDQLLKIAKFLGRKDSNLGIQREHKEDRDKEIGSFISSEHPFFPNTIIINIPLEFNSIMFDSDNQKLTINIPENSAYVLDGQHRLKAFNSKYSQNVHLDLVVTAYFNLEIPTMAEIFTRINFFQKPVTKSLVYDLLEFNPDPAFDKYRKAHVVAQLLNSKIGSPFYSKIKMLGIGSGTISQAAIVEALSTRFKILEAMGNKDIDIAVDTISNYYSSITESFSTSAIGADFFFKTIGFNASAQILSMILIKELSSTPNLIDFKSYTEIMAKAKIDIDSVKIYGGFKGVGYLVSIFQEVLVREGLL